MKRPLLLSAIFGIIAALFTALYLNSLETSYRKGAQHVKVLTAKQYIDQGTMIDATMVVETTVPKEYIQPKALQTATDIVNQDGRKLFMAIVPIEKGEQLITTKLFMLGLDTGISAIIPNDKRSVTLVLDREKVAGIIKPGNRVDVIGVFDYEDNNRRTQEASVTILQNVPILSVGTSFLGVPMPAENARDATKSSMISEPPEGRIPVSLSLSPQEAELLILASEKGTISFSLRPTADDHIVPLQIARMQDILRDASAVSADRSVEKSLPSGAQKDLIMRQHEALELIRKYQKNQGN